MKYLLIILLVGGGYYGYKNYFEKDPSIGGESVIDVINNNGFVTAGNIMRKSQHTVDFTCKDDAILKTWGSNAKKCHKRISQFQSMCQSKIFPDLEMQIRDPKKASKLYVRYADCLLPKAGE